mgnify:CR=1 FL=1
MENYIFSCANIQILLPTPKEINEENTETIRRLRTDNTMNKGRQYDEQGQTIRRMNMLYIKALPIKELGQIPVRIPAMLLHSSSDISLNDIFSIGSYPYHIMLSIDMILYINVVYN